MSTIELGLLVSVITCVVLLVLFRYETQRGSRIIERTRTRFDYLVLETLHKIHSSTQVFLKRVVKQSLHFFVHSLLASTLRIVKSIERNIALMMRTNKSKARSADRENRERNKLEEIALHKLEVALTDEEKRKHKEQVLRGDN